MTHAESQLLIVDLAFGELDPSRAAEVAEHLAGCAECQSEKAALDETRRMASPLRELEEPSPGFDDRILAAARAQAQLSHDGNIGQVVEVQGSVKPLGLEAAQIDAHSAPVLAPRRRPRWAMRAALGGSVAAAAVLALVVSTSLQTRQMHAARSAREKEFEIRIQPAPMPQAAKEAVLDAKEEAKAQKVAGGQRDDAEEQPAPAPVHLAKKSRAAPPEPAPAPAGGYVGGNVARGSGSGGDALGALADKDARGPAQERKLDQAPPPPPARATAPAMAKSEPVAQKKAAEPPKVAAAEAPAAQAVASQSGGAALKAPAMDASALEQAAQEARHGGDYLRAASLYRQAAAAHQAAGEQGGEPAWDLAHAIECLAAVGQFEQARQLRAEMAQLYPSEKSAYIAAGRAMREVDSPAAAAAAPASKAAPRGESKKADDSQKPVPADF